MVGIFTMSVDNVQEWSVKVFNRKENFSQSYENLKSTKSVSLIIARPTNAPSRSAKC